jgi:hypothetical protein
MGKKPKIPTDDKYILDDEGNPKPCYDLLEWAEWFETAREKRILASTIVGEYRVSTVFLGLNYDFTGKGLPILWETMVFERKVRTSKGLKGTYAMPSFKYNKSLDDEGFFDRYTDKTAALKGHHEIVERLKDKYKSEDKYV